MLDSNEIDGQPPRLCSTDHGVAAPTSAESTSIAILTRAAMLMDDGLIVPGVRHFSPDMRAVLKRIYGEGIKVSGAWLHKPYHLRVKEQGFIDSHGNFLTREEAWKRADALGQIFLYDPAGGGQLIPQAANQGEEGTLFSEDLY